MDNIAQNIISKIGSVDRVAEITGIDRSNVFRWTYPKNRGGTGGIIPARHHRTLIKKARELFGISLSPDDFFDIPTNTNTG